jgi:hypothetical protein
MEREGRARSVASGEMGREGKSHDGGRFGGSHGGKRRGKAFETSRRENDALILANKLLMEKLATRGGS